MFAEDPLAVRFAFDELHRLDPTKPARRQRKPADAAERVDHA